MCQEKKEEEELLALKIARMQQYDDSKTIYIKQKKTNKSDQKQYKQWNHQKNKNS